MREHTLGQLILMAAAANIRSEEANQEIDNTESSGTAAKAGSKRSANRPNKPWKQLTSTEYQQYVDSAGDGLV